jgi:hypothetical protein
MANEQLHEALRFRPWPPGDPWVLVEAVLREVEGEQQQKQVIGLALESVAATLQANLRLVEGLRQIVGGKAQAGR